VSLYCYENLKKEIPRNTQCPKRRTPDGIAIVCVGVLFMQDVICNSCGSINDYRTSKSGNHIKATCNGCDRYIKFLPQGGEPTIHFGKYKDRKISSLRNEEEIQYLKWAIKNILKMSPKLKEDIEFHLQTINRK